MSRSIWYKDVPFSPGSLLMMIYAIPMLSLGVAVSSSIRFCSLSPISLRCPFWMAAIVCVSSMFVSTIRS